MRVHELMEKLKKANPTDVVVMQFTDVDDPTQDRQLMEVTQFTAKPVMRCNIVTLYGNHRCDKVTVPKDEVSL